MKFQITLLGINNLFGRIASGLLRQSPVVGKLKVYDNNQILKEADLANLPNRCEIEALQGPNQLESALKDSDIIVIGDEHDSADIESEALISIASNIIEYCHAYAYTSPRAVLVVAASPINTLFPLVTCVLKEAGCFDGRRVLGATSVDTLRANVLYAAYLQVNPSSVILPVVGGASPQTRVPVFSQAKPYHQLSEETQNTFTNEIKKFDLCCSEGDFESNVIERAYATVRFLHSIMAGMDKEPSIAEMAMAKTSLIPEVSYFSLPIDLGVCGIERTFGLPELSNFEEEMIEYAVVNLNRDHMRAQELFNVHKPQYKMDQQDEQISEDNNESLSSKEKAIVLSKSELIDNNNPENAKKKSRRMERRVQKRYKNDRRRTKNRQKGKVSFPTLHCPAPPLIRDFPKGKSLILKDSSGLIIGNSVIINFDNNLSALSDESEARKEENEEIKMLPERTKENALTLEKKEELTNSVLLVTESLPLKLETAKEQSSITDDNKKNDDNIISAQENKEKEPTLAASVISSQKLEEVTKSKLAINKNTELYKTMKSNQNEAENKEDIAQATFMVQKEEGCLEREEIHNSANTKPSKINVETPVEKISNKNVNEEGLIETSKSEVEQNIESSKIIFSDKTELTEKIEAIVPIEITAQKLVSSDPVQLADTEKKKIYPSHIAIEQPALENQNDKNNIKKITIQEMSNTIESKDKNDLYSTIREKIKKDVTSLFKTERNASAFRSTDKNKTLKEQNMTGSSRKLLKTPAKNASIKYNVQETKKHVNLSHQVNKKHPGKLEASRKSLALQSIEKNEALREEKDKMNYSLKEKLNQENNSLLKIQKNVLAAQQTEENKVREEEKNVKDNNEDKDEADTNALLESPTTTKNSLKLQSTEEKECKKKVEDKMNYSVKKGINKESSRLLNIPTKKARDIQHTEENKLREEQKNIKNIIEDKVKTDDLLTTPTKIQTVQSTEGEETKEVEDKMHCCVEEEIKKETSRLSKIPTKKVLAIQRTEENTIKEEQKSMKSDHEDKVKGDSHDLLTTPTKIQTVQSTEGEVTKEVEEDRMNYNVKKEIKKATSRLLNIPTKKAQAIQRTEENKIKEEQISMKSDDEVKVKTNKKDLMSPTKRAIQWTEEREEHKNEEEEKMNYSVKEKTKKEVLATQRTEENKIKEEQISMKSDDEVKVKTNKKDLMSTTKRANQWTEEREEHKNEEEEKMNYSVKEKTKKEVLATQRTEENKVKEEQKSMKDRVINKLKKDNHQLLATPTKNLSVKLPEKFDIAEQETQAVVKHNVQEKPDPRILQETKTLVAQPIEDRKIKILEESAKEIPNILQTSNQTESIDNQNINFSHKDAFPEQTLELEETELPKEKENTKHEYNDKKIDIEKYTTITNETEERHTIEGKHSSDHIPFSTRPELSTNSATSQFGQHLNRKIINANKYYDSKVQNIKEKAKMLTNNSPKQTKETYQAEGLGKIFQSSVSLMNKITPSANIAYDGISLGTQKENNLSKVPATEDISGDEMLINNESKKKWLYDVFHDEKNKLSKEKSLSKSTQFSLKEKYDSTVSKLKPSLSAEAIKTAFMETLTQGEAVQNKLKSKFFEKLNIQKTEELNLDSKIKENNHFSVFNDFVKKAKSTLNEKSNFTMKDINVLDKSQKDIKPEKSTDSLQPISSATREVEINTNNKMSENIKKANIISIRKNPVENVDKTDFRSVKGNILKPYSVPELNSLDENPAKIFQMTENLKVQKYFSQFPKTSKKESTKKFQKTVSIQKEELKPEETNLKETKVESFIYSTKPKVCKLNIDAEESDTVKLMDRIDKEQQSNIEKDDRSSMNDFKSDSVRTNMSKKLSAGKTKSLISLNSKMSLPAEKIQEKKISKSDNKNIDQKFNVATNINKKVKSTEEPKNKHIQKHQLKVENSVGSKPTVTVDSLKKKSKSFKNEIVLSNAKNRLDINRKKTVHEIKHFGHTGKESVIGMKEEKLEETKQKNTVFHRISKRSEEKTAQPVKITSESNNLFSNIDIQKKKKSSLTVNREEILKRAKENLLLSKELCKKKQDDVKFVFGSSNSSVDKSFNKEQQTTEIKSAEKKPKNSFTETSVRKLNKINNSMLIEKSKCAISTVGRQLKKEHVIVADTSKLRDPKPVICQTGIPIQKRYNSKSETSLLKEEVFTNNKPNLLKDNTGNKSQIQQPEVKREIIKQASANTEQSNVMKNFSGSPIKLIHKYSNNSNAEDSAINSENSEHNRNEKETLPTFSGKNEIHNVKENFKKDDLINKESEVIKKEEGEKSGKLVEKKSELVKQKESSAENLAQSLHNVVRALALTPEKVPVKDSQETTDSSKEIRTDIFDYKKERTVKVTDKEQNEIKIEEKNDNVDLGSRWDIDKESGALAPLAMLKRSKQNESRVPTKTAHDAVQSIFRNEEKKSGQMNEKTFAKSNFAQWTPKRLKEVETLKQNSKSLFRSYEKPIKPAECKPSVKPTLYRDYTKAVRKQFIEPSLGVKKSVSSPNILPSPLAAVKGQGKSLNETNFQNMSATQILKNANRRNDLKLKSTQLFTNSDFYFDPIKKSFQFKKPIQVINKNEDIKNTTESMNREKQLKKKYIQLASEVPVQRTVRSSSEGVRQASNQPQKQYKCYYGDGVNSDPFSASKSGPYGGIEQLVKKNVKPGSKDNSKKLHLLKAYQSEVPKKHEKKVEGPDKPRRALSTEYHPSFPLTKPKTSLSFPDDDINKSQTLKRKWEQIVGMFQSVISHPEKKNNETVMGARLSKQIYDNVYNYKKRSNMSPKQNESSSTYTSAPNSAVLQGKRPQTSNVLSQKVFKNTVSSVQSK